VIYFKVNAEASEFARGDPHFSLVVTDVKDVIEDPEGKTVTVWVTRVLCCRACYNTLQSLVVSCDETTQKNIFLFIQTTKQCFSTTHSV
jgi:hypothetical protein